MMTTPRKTAPGCTLRERIAELRQEISTANADYEVAKECGQSDTRLVLLRRQSVLAQELFRAQTELLLGF